MIGYDIDSFGNRVKVGDYVYFRSKGQYVPDAMSVGVIRKMTGKSITIEYVNQGNKTLEDYTQHRADHIKNMEADLASPSATPWVLTHYPGIIKDFRNNPFGIETTRLASASSTIKVPEQAISVQLRQILDRDDFIDGII